MCGLFKGHHCTESLGEAYLAYFFKLGVCLQPQAFVLLFFHLHHFFGDGVWDLRPSFRRSPTCTTALDHAPQLLPLPLRPEALAIGRGVLGSCPVVALAAEPRRQEWFLTHPAGRERTRSEPS